MKDSKQEIAEIAENVLSDLIRRKHGIHGASTPINRALRDMLSACLYHLRESGQPVNLDALCQIHVELEKMRAEEAEATK